MGSGIIAETGATEPNSITLVILAIPNFFIIVIDLSLGIIGLIMEYNEDQLEKVAHIPPWINKKIPTRQSKWER
jgi:hypothetical protein